MSTTTLGGWSPFTTDISSEELAVFNTAVAGLDGVVYMPLEVSKQVVAGMNYRFISSAKVVAPDTETYMVMIQIYAPLPGQGQPHITQITRL